MGRLLRLFLRIGVLFGLIAAAGQLLKRQQNSMSSGDSYTPEPAGDPYAIDESKLGGEVSQDLLDILVCPADKQSLEYVDGKWLVCHTCGRRYPITDGIPVMLVEVGDRYRDESLITQPTV